MSAAPRHLPVRRLIPRGALGFLAACGLLLACGTARAEQTVFGIRMGDSTAPMTQPDRRRNRALLSHWPIPVRDKVRLVEPSDPLDPLVHYSVRLAADGKICEIKGISDPITASQSEEILKPILFSLVQNFEEVFLDYATYANYVDEHDAKLRFHNWAALMARIEREGKRYGPVVGWTLLGARKRGVESHERIGLLRVAIYVDPDRKLRAAVEAINASYCNTD